MIQIENLTFLYEQEGENKGVYDISLHIPPGNCTVLCGPSGCGKTTLLRIVSGLAPNIYQGDISGSLMVNGQPPAVMTSKEKALTFGMVFQDPRSQFFMSNVQEEISFSGENIGIASQDILNKIEKLTTQLGLTDLMHSDLNCLSSGQKQKVAIAAASLLNPPLLILDEPTANLDAEGTAALIKMLTEIKSRGTTILISEHRLHCYLPVADQFVCLYHGRIAASWNRDAFCSMDCETAEQFSLRHPDSGKVETYPKSTLSAQGEFLVQDVSFRYAKGEPILNLPNFSIKPGHVTAITGKNGKGKTTLGRILCGLLRQKQGQILCNGKQLSAKHRCQRSYFVMQDSDYQLYSENVGDELVLGCKVTASLRRRAYEAMELFDLTKYKDRHPASLSGGEKQRVTLAAAYCSDAELIILDEPTSGLDVINAKKVALFIQQLALQNRAVVVITHDELLLRLAGESIVHFD